MPDPAEPLSQLSGALVARAQAAKNSVVAIRLGHERYITGLVWRSGVVVASEQSLPRRDEFELVGSNGSVLTAKVAGRDPSTNVAILKPADSISAPELVSGEALAGAIALAIGADGAGGV